MMSDLSRKQKESLEEKTRRAIYTYLQKQERPVTLGTIIASVEGVPVDRAKAFRHLAILVDIGLVEQRVDISLTYRAVGR